MCRLVVNSFNYHANFRVVTKLSGAAPKLCGPLIFCIAATRKVKQEYDILADAFQDSYATLPVWEMTETDTWYRGKKRDVKATTSTFHSSRTRSILSSILLTWWWRQIWVRFMASGSQFYPPSFPSRNICYTVRQPLGRLSPNLNLNLEDLVPEVWIAAKSETGLVFSLIFWI